MKTPRRLAVRVVDVVARGVDLCLLRGAWLLVPGAQRAEWWREWYGELWQARRAYAEVTRSDGKWNVRLPAFAWEHFRMRRVCGGLSGFQRGKEGLGAVEFWVCMAVPFGSGAAVGRQFRTGAITAGGTRRAELFAAWSAIGAGVN